MPTPDFAHVDPSRPRAVPGWHVPLLLAAALLALFSRFLRAHPLGFFEDDFFYYVQVARNLALHHLSTFDGTHLTNGYHPLWLLVIAALFRIFPGLAFFIAVQVASLLLLFVFLRSARSLFTRLAVPAPAASLAALLLSLHALLLFRYGMEVTLALPLALVAIAFALAPRPVWTLSDSFTLALLASLAVLARLDLILLVVLFVASAILQSPIPWRARLRHLLLFTLGFTPFFLYLLLNLHWFHVLLPISGAAKQMKPLFPPSFIPARSFFYPPDRMKLAFVLPAVALLALAIPRFLRLRVALTRPERVLYPALLLFPFVHLTTLSFLSDWPVWAWYFYSLSLSSIAGLGLFLRPNPYPTTVTRRACQALCALYVLYLVVYSVKRQPAPIFFLASGIAEFTRHHPGTYAMGDGAGTPAFLSDQPFVQLEGLTMDAAYLNLVRRSTPLPQVLAAFNVRYYIALYAGPVPHCVQRAEPSQAGPRSPHMLGHLCAAPLAQFSNADTYASIYNASDVQ